jgi:hypothetical protein
MGAAQSRKKPPTLNEQIGALEAKGRTTRGRTYRNNITLRSLYRIKQYKNTHKQVPRSAVQPVPTAGATAYFDQQIPRARQFPPPEPKLPNLPPTMEVPFIPRRMTTGNFQKNITNIYKKNLRRTMRNINSAVGHLPAKPPSVFNEFYGKQKNIFSHVRGAPQPPPRTKLYTTEYEPTLNEHLTNLKKFNNYFKAKYPAPAAPRPAPPQPRPRRRNANIFRNLGLSNTTARGRLYREPPSTRQTMKFNFSGYPKFTPRQQTIRWRNANGRLLANTRRFYKNRPSISVADTAGLQ